MSATSKWSFLFGAHFIRPSASANWSISSSRRSVSINSACAASDSCESRSTSSLSASGFTLNTSRSRKYEIRSAISRIMSLPASHCSCSNCTASAVAERKILSVKFATVWWLVNPKTFNTSASLIGSPQNATSWSSIDSASRSPPSAPRAIACAAAGSSVIFSLPAMNCRCCAIKFAGMRCRSKRWQRLRIVGRTFCGSVVAKINFTCGGGSSNVLSSALKAADESMCTSSIR